MKLVKGRVVENKAPATIFLTYATLSTSLPRYKTITVSINASIDEVIIKTGLGGFMHISRDGRDRIS